MYGTHKDQGILVKEIVYVPYLSGTQHWWYDRSSTEDERLSGKFLGRIHSHCDTIEETPDERDLNAIPSPYDWDVAFRQKEMIHGICHIRLPNKAPRTISYFYLGYLACLDLEVT